jgi:hypothetical protein
MKSRLFFVLTLLLLILGLAYGILSKNQSLPSKKQGLSGWTVLSFDFKFGFSSEL